MSIISPFSSSTRKIYYKPGRAIAVAVVFVILLLLMWKVIQEYADHSWVYWLFLAIELASIVIALYAILRDRVVISDTGIEFYQLGYRHSTTWNNIDRIEQVWIGLKYFDVLMLREPAVQINKWLAWRVKDEEWMEHGEQFIPLAKTIPLFVFKRDWRTSDIGQDIQYYAPRLFVEASPKAEERKTSPSFKDVT